MMRLFFHVEFKSQEEKPIRTETVKKAYFIMIQSILKNPTALETLHNMKRADEGLRKNMENISTGKLNNSAGDDPSNIVLAGMLENQINSTEQAKKNNEVATMFVQTAEASLSEINEMLIRVRQLAVHASNEAVNDEESLSADQSEIDNLLQSIDQISDFTQFGNRYLLDGSNGTIGYAVGEGMLLLDSAEKTQNSPSGGYPVNIESLATKGYMEGNRAMMPEEITNGGIFLEVEIDGRHISYETKAGETPKQIKYILQKKFDQNGLPLDISINDYGVFRIENHEYGAGEIFNVANSASGIFTSEDEKIEISKSGKDIVGTVGGYEMIGKGQELTAKKGTPIEGMRIKFFGELNLQKGVAKDRNGNLIPDDSFKERNGLEGSNSINHYKGGVEGVIQLKNNSLFFHVGAGKYNNVQLDLKSSKTNSLGKNIENESEFKKLADINVMDFQKAQDSIRITDKAISEIVSMRARIGAVQVNSFERNMNNLALSYENLSAAKSEISDTNIAREISELTKNKMWLESSTGVLARNSNNYYSWMNLLKS